MRRNPPPFPKDIGAALFHCLEVQGFQSESEDLSDNQAWKEKSMNKLWTCGPTGWRLSATQRTALLKRGYSPMAVSMTILQKFPTTWDSSRLMKHEALRWVDGSSMWAGFSGNRGSTNRRQWAVKPNNCFKGGIMKHLYTLLYQSLVTGKLCQVALMSLSTYHQECFWNIL